MEKFKDFVCGNQIDKDKSAASFEYQGKTYHFCSQKCRDDFSKNPANFIK